MPKKSAANDFVRRAADEIPPADPAHLADLLAAMDGPIDTSEIPEKTGAARRVKRDAAGRLPERRDSPIRRAILDALDRRGMNRYRLWQEARGYCETLSQSAVYEYLGGRRKIGLPYAEALMQAAGLYVSFRKTSRVTAVKGATGRRKAAKGAAG